MVDKISALNNRIRFSFAVNKRPISITVLQEKVFDLYPNHDILSVALMDLKTRGLIKIENELILPVDNEGIIRDLEGNDRHSVRREGILKVLNLIGQGTPAEVGTTYLKFIDSQANIETITRLLRQMWSDGEVFRNGDVYYAIVKPSQTLKGFE